MKRGRLPVAVARGPWRMGSVGPTRVDDMHVVGALAEVALEVIDTRTTVAKLHDGRLVVEDVVLQALTGLPEETYHEALKRICNEIPDAALVRWREAGGVREGRSCSLVSRLLSSKLTASCPTAVRLLHEALLRLVDGVDAT